MSLLVRREGEGTAIGPSRTEQRNAKLAPMRPAVAAPERADSRGVTVTTPGRRGSTTTAVKIDRILVNIEPVGRQRHCFPASGLRNRPPIFYD